MGQIKIGKFWKLLHSWPQKKWELSKTDKNNRKHGYNAYNTKIIVWPKTADIIY